jgi:hypothetical protein
MQLFLIKLSGRIKMIQNVKNGKNDYKMGHIMIGVQIGKISDPQLDFPLH